MNLRITRIPLSLPPSLKKDKGEKNNASRDNRSTSDGNHRNKNEQISIEWKKTRAFDSNLIAIFESTNFLLLTVDEGKNIRQK